MKKQKLIFTTAAAMALVGALTFGAIQSQASATVEQEAKQVMTHYLDAVVANNAQDAVKYVVDSRYKDTSAAIDGYQETMSSDPVYRYKIVSVTPTSSTKATVTVAFSSKNAGDSQVELSAEKYGQEWKVVLDKVPTVKGK